MNITVITVVLNDLNSLKMTYLSLLNQTSKAFQWIIKDGGSIDGTDDFYLSVIKPSSLNVQFLAERDESVYDAMNQAIIHINNRYVLFLNSGDQLADNYTISKVDEKINLLKEDQCFIYGDNIDITKNGLSIYKKARELKYLHNSLPTSHQSIFYNRILLDKYKYSLRYLIAADYALTAQMYFDGNHEYVKLDFPISKFYLGGLSTVRRDILLKEGYEIHLNIVKDSFIKANVKYLKRYFTFFILDNFPNVYNQLRKFL